MLRMAAGTVPSLCAQARCAVKPASRSRSPTNTVRRRTRIGRCRLLPPRQHPSPGEPAGCDQLLGELTCDAGIGTRQGALRVWVRDTGENVTNDVESCLMLVIGAHDDPRGMLMVRSGEHRVACATVVAPVALGRFVDRADLPLLERITPAAAQPTSLLVAADIEIVLEKNDVRARQHPFEAWRGFQERLVFFGRAILHDEFDAGPVVPAAIEQNDLARRWQVTGKALEVPLRLLAVARLAKGHDAHFTRAEVLGDAFDRPVLAGGVPAFEYCQHSESCSDHLAVQLDQLYLQTPQLARVIFPGDLRHRLECLRLFLPHTCALVGSAALHRGGAGGAGSGGNGTNSLLSKSGNRMRPARQSAFAWLMRACDDETKFQSMKRSPTGSPPSAITTAGVAARTIACAPRANTSI